MTSTHTPCPDPEVLAAWLDQGLTSAERDRVTRHLAACADCRMWVTNVLSTLDAIHEEPAVAVPVPGNDRGTREVMTRVSSTARSRRIFWGAASALTVAAMLLVIVQFRPWAARTGSIDAKLADLVVAVGNERTVEARLSGGFRFGPLRSPVRSGGSSAAAASWELLSIAGKIREDAEQDPNPANLHALGLAYLLIGQHDDSVRALEDAVAGAPDNARYHSDLSAAYFSRARLMDRPDDYPRALEAAERAVKIDQALIEARFNRALALEGLFLTDQARRAWEDYLGRDSTSGWAEEARRHREALTSTGASVDPNAAPAITATSVEAGLDWLLRIGLPQWAGAAAAGDGDGASRRRAQLLDHAAVMTAHSGDRFAEDLVTEVVVNADSTAVSDHVRTVVGFADGLARIEQDDLPGAEHVFRGSCPSARGLYAHLCHLEIGTADVIRRRDADAEVHAQAIVASGATRYVYIEARLKRLQGYRRLFQSDQIGSARAYRESFDAASRGKYLQQAASLAMQIAELQDLLGVPFEPWKWRLRALQLTQYSQAPSVAYQVKWSTADALGRSGQPRAALSVVAELADRAAMPIPPLKRAGLEVVRARAAVAADEGDMVQHAIETARQLIEQTDDYRGMRLMPNLLSLASVAAVRDRDYQTAYARISEAISLLGPERGHLRVAHLLSRAEISARRGDSEDRSEDDLREALNLLRNRTDGLPTQPLRPREAIDALESIAYVVASRPQLQNTRGLLLAEQFRELVDGTAVALRLSTVEAVDRALSRLQPNQAVAAFLFGENSLLVWTATSAGRQFTTRPVSEDAINRLAATLEVQIRRSPEREDLWRATLAELFDHIIAGLPPHIQSANELIVIPDGSLNRVPLGAMFDRRTRRYLFESSAVRVAPNLAVALSDAPATAVARHEKGVLAVGEPTLIGRIEAGLGPLPHAKAEALAVAGLYTRRKTLVGDEATPDEVLKAVRDADVFHFAGHAVAPAAAEPRLFLAGNVADPATTLRSDTLLGRLKPSAHVVLAACEAGRPAGDRGSGNASISAAFLRAGAKSVIANIWPVDDRASQSFFVNVHRALLDNASSAQAVARAQRLCRNDPTCRRAGPTWIGTTAYGSQ